MPALLDPIRQLAGKRKQPTPAKTEDQEKQKAIAADLEKSLTRLEAALEAKQLKESRQLLKTVQQQFKSLDRRHGKPFQARMQLLNGQMRELSDWLGFATEPKQIELCEQMEYLAEQPIEPEAKAERIRREAKGEADGILLKYEAEAEGLRKLLESKADGYAALVNSTNGDAKSAATLLLIVYPDGGRAEDARAHLVDGEIEELVVARAADRVLGAVLGPVDAQNAGELLDRALVPLH